MTSFWASADAYLASECATVFGVGGEYATLQAQQFINGNIAWRPEQWTKPTILIASRDVRPSDEEFGNIFGVHSTYDYQITVAQEHSDYATVSSNAKEYYARLVKFIHERRTLGGLTVDGETAHRVIWQRGIVDLQERNQSLYWGITTILFQVESSR